MDTIGTEESVLNKEVSSFQGLNCVSELHLREENVYLLERCLYFMGVLKTRSKKFIVVPWHISNQYVKFKKIKNISPEHH